MNNLAFWWIHLTNNSMPAPKSQWHLGESCIGWLTAKDIENTILHSTTSISKSGVTPRGDAVTWSFKESASRSPCGGWASVLGWPKMKPNLSKSWGRGWWCWTMMFFFLLERVQWSKQQQALTDAWWRGELMCFFFEWEGSLFSDISRAQYAVS